MGTKNQSISTQARTESASNALALCNRSPAKCDTGDTAIEPDKRCNILARKLWRVRALTNAIFVVDISNVECFARLFHIAWVIGVSSFLHPFSTFEITDIDGPG